MESSIQLVISLGLITGFLIVESRSVPSEDEGEASPGCSCGCPPGWTRFGSRCFIFYQESKTWTEAERLCISIGGNLASIHSPAENNFLSEHVKRVTGGFYATWIGAFDAVTEKSWLWSDGSRFDYSSWSSGQPDNGSGKEHCGEMNFHGSYWNDEQCDSTNPFVCSKDIC